MRTIVIKNNTAEEKIWNKSFLAGEEYTIPNDTGLWLLYATLDVLLVAIATGEALIGDGSQFFGTVSEQIIWLRNETQTPTDDEGAELIRPKTTHAGWMQSFRCLEFRTAKFGSLFSEDASGTPFTDTWMKLFREDGSEITSAEDEVQAVRTEFYWEPPFDFDFAGALWMIDAELTQDVRAWAIAVPDIPKEYGGSKQALTGGFNLRFVKPGIPFVINGRTPKRMFYNATYHTNKLKAVFKHAAGFQLGLLIVMDKYQG